MKFKVRLILLIIVLCFPFLYSSVAVGQDNIPDLKGKWSGIAFLYADAKGFSVSKGVLNLVVKKQYGLNFSGDIEFKDKGTVRQFEFSGFLNKQKKRYICLIIQGKDVSIGYLTTKNTIKVHLRSFGNNAEITVYMLTKEKNPSVSRSPAGKSLFNLIMKDTTDRVNL
jgi:hypothetical protein